ncbi:Vesicle tethering protein p115-like protein [Metarhizium album ARSEF 1941]|uniref:Vesicle tethering protein p115-like protein n=1 Tax=Metarhizium album (strain ARSEF 1941) TaxID=1081103 RepID=A0A0B2X0C8_METAS|nr:Vesicle tethering protein p115-like protein [Metarhizium album ARSEF 1941]KHN99274.1 Vesicle tethering protein p115-like protein [Metarhizium album ARSEF 1941]
MFSISTTPAKQSVSETITVLSGRLSSATLLEDRRAAILGLRSFAKDFPASVASGALRCLIGSLSKDGDDVDTVKVVLETLLMLFSPNEKSPEASDEVILWLADEFTQRQENITLLLDFVESKDFYSRLYSLQLLAAILSARTERTEECIFTAPLGISRLVATLDDQREAVRNECISLLIALTPTSTELQKLVAFESAFDRIFTIVAADGSLTQGGRTVEDCLILLANLLRRNASNQSLFRESGCIAKLASLLEGLLQAQLSDADIAEWAQAQRNRNLYAYLAVLRLFLLPGSAGVLQNQQAFWKQGLVHNILQLAFSREEGQVAIKAEALTTCGDMIRDARPLQETFAQLLVPVPAPLLVGMGKEDESSTVTTKTYVIDGLLDLTLNSFDQTAFDLRFSACECLKAYFSNHSEVRLHFLSRAIDGYMAAAEESANILTVLLRPDPTTSIRDPYRQWFASVIAFHLIHENPTAKARLLQVTEGDSSKDEEVVTSIQTIAAHLITSISRSNDARISVGYLMLLLGWTFEDLDAVNDFLAEGSNVQSLIQAISQPVSGHGVLIQGLCAFLLGVVYEFSTKDSPLSRTSFHSVLSKRLDREQFMERLTRLRSHPLMRDFEVTPQKHHPSLGNSPPDIFFDSVFVDFFKDNYSRIGRSIDRAPELEISVMTNGVQKGISRELVDSLRSQVRDKDRALQETKARITSLEEALHNREAQHRLSSEATAIELSELKASFDNAGRVHEEQLRKLAQEHLEKAADQERRTASVQAQLTAREIQHQTELVHAQQSAGSEVERVRLRADAELADLKASMNRLEANKSKASELQKLQEENSRLLTLEVEQKTQAETRNSYLEGQLRIARTRIEELQRKVERVEKTLLEESDSKRTTQAELDDLLMVFGDLEEKVARYKARLRKLGENVSDGEDDEEDGLKDADGEVD